MAIFLKEKIFTAMIVLCLLPILSTQIIYAQTASPEGFAAITALGCSGTTGGVGGEIVTVTNSAQFLDYIKRSGRYIIQLAGTITLSGMVDVKSDKTIIGVDSSGVITDGGLNMSQASNIIIQNLLFQNSNVDAINIENESHHIWVDHCDFTRAFDGLIDIKSGSDYITISWNTFFDHQKTCLLGHDDTNAAQDSGRLRVTYHHNWFKGTVERHPRARFSGLCHVYNNFYLNNNYGVASTMNAEVLVEHNYFKGVVSPTLVGYGSSGPGDLVNRDNIFDNCPGNPKASGQVPEPPYSYSVDSAANIPTIVQHGAGRTGFHFSPITAAGWLVYDASVLPDQNEPAFSAVEVANPPDTISWIIDDPDIAGNKLLQFINPFTLSGSYISSITPTGYRAEPMHDCRAELRHGCRAESRQAYLPSKYMWGFDWKLDAASGATIAFRVKPIDPAIYQRTFEVEFRDGNIREQLLILPGGIIKLDQANATNVLPTAIDEWHTYRVTYKNGVSRVYVDEASIPLLIGVSTSASASSDIRFGDGSDDDTYGFLLDWFIFDTTGVYAPGELAIPETLFVDKPTVAYKWQVYDASVLPSENDPIFLPSNVKNPFDTTSWIIADPDLSSNRLLKFINPQEVDSKFMWGRNWGMDDDIGATIAFRVKPIDRQLYERTFEVEIRDGSLRERLLIQRDGMIELGRAAVQNILPSRPDGWHTFRITFQKGESRVYLDEASTPFISGVTTSASSTNDIRFGDGSDADTHGFLLDWLIFDVTGAYLPGESIIPDSLIVDQPEPVAVENETEAIPDDFIIAQNYPNPFNPRTTISLQLPRAGYLRLTIFDLSGHEVTTLLDEILPQGQHQVTFNAAEYASGIYFYQVKMGDCTAVKKMVLLK